MMNNLILSPIAASDLVQMIASEVEARIKNLPTATQKTELENDQRFHGDKELAEYLNCSVQTVNQLKKTGQITFHRMGRRCYYLRSEIDRNLQVEARRFNAKRK